MDILTINDRPGEYPPNSYYTASAGTPLSYPSLEGEIVADVVIVGAGFTGLSTALHLAKAGFKVVCLDANRVGWGASGRNGGQAHPTLRRDQEYLEKLVGKDRARALWDLSIEATRNFSQVIEDHKIDCNYKPGLIHASRSQKEVDEDWRYLDFLNREYGSERIEKLNRTSMQEEVSSTHYAGGLFLQDGGHVHPLKLAQGLARAAETAGAQLFDNSRVTKVNEGKQVVVYTEHGSVTADYAVLALNGYHNDFSKNQSRYVMPINNFIIATEPLGEERALSLIRRNAAVADSYFVVNYFRLTADFRMLFGGGENYTYRFPDRMAETARKRMLTIFPQLFDVRTDYCWGGTLGITVNRMPVFQRQTANILSASGFSGQGVVFANYAGKIVSDVIRGQAERFDLMEGLPRTSFPGGALLRWPLLFTAMFAASLRDRL